MQPPTVSVGLYFLNESLVTRSYGTTSSAMLGTYLQGSSNATAKNLVSLYDNTAGIGRPLATTLVENSGAAVAGTSTIYQNGAGNYNTLIPNDNTSGVKRAVQYSVVDGSLVGCQSSATAFAGTDSPTGGTTPVAISSTTAPLDVDNCSGTPANTALSISNGTFSSTAVGNNSNSTNFTLTNTSGTAQVVTLSGLSAPFTYTGSTITVPAKTGGMDGVATFVIKFTPTAAGTFSSTVTAAVTGFQNVTSSSFSGAATNTFSPSLDVTQGGTSYPSGGTTYAFTPAQNVNVATAAVPFTLTNSGSGAITITGITYGGTNGADFRHQRHGPQRRSQRQHGHAQH